MKKKFLAVAVCLPLLLLLGFLAGKYLLAHRIGYGAINDINTAIPNGFLFTQRDEIPASYRITESYQDIQQIGGMFSDTFYCQKLGKNAEIIEYWKQTAGYGITGGWSYRFAAVCGDDYIVVYGADHLGEALYGPFSLKEKE